MNTDEYMLLAKRTASGNWPLETEGLSRVLHSVLGCGDEAGELQKLIKDHLYYNAELTFTALKEEYGDLLWFISEGLGAIGSSFEEVMEMNIAKLRKRYPDKFEHDKAVNRDTNAELKVLEKFVADIRQEDRTPFNDTEIWRGSPITNCQLCEQKIDKRFIDGQTQGGSWGIMCTACHATSGCGLGTGKGQEYVLVGATYLKAAQPKQKGTLGHTVTMEGVPVAASPVNQTMIDLIAEVALPTDVQIKCDINLYHAVMSGKVPGKIVKDADGGYSLQVRE